MFRGVTSDGCNRDLMTLFYSLRLWFYSLNICNPNDDFISINETKKQSCLFFKTCNDQKDSFHGNTCAGQLEFNEKYL